jgi:hypothetical protein
MQQLTEENKVVSIDEDEVDGEVADQDAGQAQQRQPSAQVPIQGINLIFYTLKG